MNPSSLVAVTLSLLGVRLFGAEPAFRAGVGKVEITPPAGVPMAQWAQAWCLRNPLVSAVIPGCKDAAQVASNGKLGIDATKKMPDEGFKRPWPPLIKMDAAVKAKVEKLFNP